MSRPTSLVAVAALALVGCGGGGGSDTELEPGPTVAGFEFTNESAVVEGEPIDARFTCDGEDVSLALAWEGVPEGTGELALVLEDPDAPGATFTHWLVYGLGPTVTGLPAGDRDWTGYGPGTPREGENDFIFRLLSLDAPLELASGADRATFDESVAPHLLAEARLTATYARG